MEIKRGVINNYLNDVASYIGDIGCLPDNVTEYYDSVMDMKKNAARQGHLDILLLGIDYLLLDPNIDATDFAQTYNIFDLDEMEEFLKYIRSVAFSDAPPLNPETIKDVELV